jgi:hypothetical protein
MKIKTSELTGSALDWAVAEIENPKPEFYRDNEGLEWEREYKPSTNWSQGGPIIEREGLQLRKRNDHYFPEPFWQAGRWIDITLTPGPTPLIAAMRCYVASKLGDEIEIPEELL